MLYTNKEIKESLSKEGYKKAKEMFDNQTQLEKLYNVFEEM
jgi:hypothetical protein